MKERDNLFLIVWVWFLGVSAGLIICGLFLFPRVVKVYEVVPIDAGPIVVTIKSDVRKSSEGVLAASRVHEIREWVIRIPTKVIAFENTTAYVTLLQNGTAYDVPVSLGVVGDEFAEVVSGVSFGDMIVTRIKQ